jgi:heptosyltransferase III
MRLLLYHAGALGDFITIVPSLRLLRLVFPSAEVTLLGRPAFGELARAHGLVDRVVDAASTACAPLYSGAGRDAAHGALGTFDRAMLFTRSLPLVEACRAVAPLTSVHLPFPETSVSAYRFHLRSVAAALGRAWTRATWRALAPPLLSPAPRPRQPTAVLHPGSGSAAKTWPTERLAPVAEALRKRGLRVVWSLGPADRSIRATVARIAREGDAVLTDASPTELAAELSQASLYVGMDSGVSHLAAAVGCPSVLLFGPTSRVVWRPPGRHVLLVPRRLACPSPAQSGRACEPPPRGERCAQKENGVPACLLATQAREVLDAVEELTRSGLITELAHRGRDG